MSTITADEVSRIAQLARLGLTEQEKTEATVKLDGVLKHFTSIQAVDTSRTPPTDAVSGLTNIARFDTVGEQLCTPAALLSAAPATVRNHIQVKAVL